MSSIKNMLGGTEEQRELFLLKFSDIERVDVDDMCEAFMKFDKTKSGSLDERSVQLMFADLGVHKTLAEMRTMLSAIDFNQGATVQFMELCCASFGKDFNALMDHTDKEAVEKAAAAAAAHKALEDEAMRKHLAEEEEARRQQEILEKESQLVC